MHCRKVMTLLLAFSFFCLYIVCQLTYTASNDILNLDISNIDIKEKKMAREQLKNLTEPMYYILLALINENHGYGIMQMVDELTDGRVEVGAGTLYALLGRFEKEGIIVQTAEENRRKIYKLTDKGMELVKGEFIRLNQLVSDGQKFFEYDGDRKEPPEDGDGGEKETDKVRVRVLTTAFSGEDTKAGEAEQEEEGSKGRLNGGRGGLSYGGTY